MAKLLGAAGGIVGAAALLIVLYASASKRGAELHCRNNLRQLGAHAASNWPLIDPQKRGRAFWQEVRIAQYRDVNGAWKPMSPDPFVCPVHDRTKSDRERAEAIDYRGPRKVTEEAKAYGSAAPLGADRLGNHGSGGWVLRMDTSVDALPPLVGRVDEGDPLWKAAADALTD
jgi:hypothetical protein